MKRSLYVLVAFFSSLVLMPVYADDWPQWRGPNRDGKSKETGLLQQWPEGGPKLVWQATEMGEGYSTPSVSKERVYLLGSPDEKTEHVIALDEKTGKIIWQVAIGKVGPNPKPKRGQLPRPALDAHG